LVSKSEKNVYSSRMANVQLSDREAVRVFLDSDTGRILGMAPVSIPAPLCPGIRWRSETLIHVWEIEAYLNRWREQVKQEAVIRTERQAQRDSIFRSSIASSIRARNQSVNQWNRDENNRLLKKMDDSYEKQLKKQMNPQLYGVAESTDSSASAADIALDSPYFKHGPERIAEGERVDPRKVQ
jgi:hypothetical protein